MKNRELFFRTINFDNPEKVLQYPPTYVLWYLGANHQGYDDVDVDNAHDCPVGSRWKDIWGTTWYKEHPDVMGFPKKGPLENPKDLSGYRWPDPNDERLISKIYEKKAFYNNDDMLLAGSHRDTLWEKSYMLVGMENMMDYFFSEPEYAKEILHHIMNFQLGIAKHYIQAGVEMACLGDDLGTQISLLLGPNIFSEFLVSEYRRLFDFYKKHNVIITFHSCGHIEPLLENFINLGVNILNPVQATANNLERVIETTQGKMALHGGISSQLIMEGSYEDIRSKVENTIRLLGKNGGYFCDTDQVMPYPKDNYDVFLSAIDEYGKCPVPVNHI